MSNFWIDTANIAGASILGLLSFIDNISKRSFARKRKAVRDALEFLKRTRVKLSIVLVVGIVAFLTNREKYKNVDRDKEAADKAFKRELDFRDSVIQERFNESLSRSSGASAASAAETMAKYYLKYDSVQHHIEAIVKDSTNRKILRPELAIGNIECNVGGDSVTVVTTLIATQNTAYNVHFTCTYVVRMYPFSNDEKYLQIIKNDPLIVRNPIVPNQISKTITNHFNNVYFTASKPKLYVYLKGTYQDLNKKAYNYEDLYYYDFGSQKSGDLTTREYNWIYSFLKKNSL
jgi:hypothetical protein